VEFQDEYGSELSSASIYRHPQEILSLSAAPTSADLFFSIYSVGETTFVL
jgi:hypothetical protein